MSLKNRLKDPKTLLNIGLVCFLLGQAVHWFVRPTDRVALDVVDGIFGLLLGLSIGLTLWSLRLRRKES
jgi:uncharacterized membrane protein YhhN